VVIKAPTWFVWMFLSFISKSSKITFVGEENLRKIEEKGQRIIFVFWHSCYTLLLVSIHPKKAVALVHLSFRGNYVAELASAFNYRIVRISTRNRRSVLQLVEKIQEGYPGFIAVDGPQGPPYRVKPGTIRIAQRTKAAIVPTCARQALGQAFYPPALQQNRRVHRKTYRSEKQRFP